MPLPGLRRLDHIGFTVPDLDAAHRWLVEVLGCEYLYSLGPFRHDDSDWMTTHLNVHPRAEMVENRWFRLGDQAVLEVFCYSSPDQADAMPRNSDIGGHHVALYVGGGQVIHAPQTGDVVRYASVDMMPPVGAVRP